MPSPSHSGRDNGDAGKRDAEGAARDLQRVAQAGDPRFAALSSATAAPKREQACLPRERSTSQAGVRGEQRNGGSELPLHRGARRPRRRCLLFYFNSDTEAPASRLRSPPELTGLPVQVPFQTRRNRVILGLPLQIRVCCRADVEAMEAYAHEERLRFRRRDFIGTCVGTAIGLVRVSATILFYFFF